MPSFLSKVFGRKKDERDTASPTSPSTEKRSSAPTLLEGKYEAVSPNVSPSASHFPDSGRLNVNQPKDSPLGLFRPKSKNVDQPRKSATKASPAPTLTLNLPARKEANTRALDVVFESVPEEASESAAGERRLNPQETLSLVEACAKAIIEHGGLETLGLMHPHWFAASDEVQKKLISLFVLSLGPRPAGSTLSPNPDSSLALFDSELKYTRSPHDVAAVLRWGLRHLKLEGTSFGKDASEWNWYTTFAKAERQADFPAAAFSKTLGPLLPPAHYQLLTATLDIIESLAAHAETTGSSGSKLAMLFGLWLVSAQRVDKDEDWTRFYQRWESAGRILEHLFLSHVREESSLMKMPIRLSEMVKHYPYGTPLSTEDGESLPFLTQPRFSTRRYDALFVRIDTELPAINSPRPPRKHPLHLIFEAVKATAAPDTNLPEDVLSVWEDIKMHTVEDKQYDTVEGEQDDTAEGEQDISPPNLSKILDDESLRILKLVPGAEVMPPVVQATETIPPTSPVVVRAQPSRRRSSSLGPANQHSANGTSRDGTVPPTDWADFSKLGFGESTLGPDLNLTLADNDVEVTSPKATSPVVATWSKRRRASSPGRGRRSSMDNPRTEDEQRGRSGADILQNLPTRLAHVGTVKIDEAFVDFWSDALLDPIASDWPSFVVCQLKPSMWKYNLLVIEQTFTRPEPPPLPPIPQFESTRRASSPRPSLAPSSRGRRSFNFSPTIKRFSFFSTHNTSVTDVTSKTAGKKGASKASTKTPRIGEMGEILPEDSAPVSAGKPVSSQPTEAPKEPEALGLGITTVKPVRDGDGEQKNGAPITVPTNEIAPGAPEAIDQTEQKEPELPAAPVSALEETAEDDLPAVPLVDVITFEVVASAGEVPPSAIEPVNTDEDVSEPISVPAATVEDLVEQSLPPNTEDQLPAAPAAIVLTGGTPGPQVALDTSEPVTLAEASEAAPMEAPISEDEEAGSVPADVTAPAPKDDADAADAESVPAMEGNPVIPDVEPVAANAAEPTSDDVPESVLVSMAVEDIPLQRDADPVADPQVEIAQAPAAPESAPVDEVSASPAAAPTELPAEEHAVTGPSEEATTPLPDTEQLTDEIPTSEPPAASSETPDAHRLNFVEEAANQTDAPAEAAGSPAVDSTDIPGAPDAADEPTVQSNTATEPEPAEDVTDTTGEPETHTDVVVEAEPSKAIEATSHDAADTTNGHQPQVSKEEPVTDS